jgi:hypothetical protein
MRYEVTVIAFHGHEVTRGGADIRVMAGNNQEPGSSPPGNPLHYAISVTTLAIRASAEAVEGHTLLIF